MTNSVKLPPMQLTNINGIELEVYDSGSDGEPVVFVHAVIDEWLAVLAEPIITEKQNSTIFYGNATRLSGLIE